METSFSGKTIVVSLSLIFCLFLSKYCNAQLKGDDLKSAIESGKFSFVVTHESGGDFALGSNYYLKVIQDSISAALPFSGRSNTASYTMSENGINVNTKKFTYDETATKKGGYFIKIVLKNDRVTNSFSLRVNKNGMATLAAESYNRDSQVYSGGIMPL